jgi:hypothetical protein
MKFQRTAIAIAALATLTCAVPAGAVNNPIWQSAKPAALPAGGTFVYNGYLPYLSCPSAGNCVAGGVYIDASGHDRGLLLNEINGVWRAPTPVTPPSNAVAKDGVYLSGISCGSIARCVAVGTYFDAAGNQLSFVDDQVNGVWLVAKEVQLPANADKASQVSAVHSIECSSAGNCSAVGTYDTTATPTPFTEGFVMNEVGGTWHNPSEVVLPVSIRGNPYVTINQIACGSAGNCSAVGSYIDTNNVTHALAINEVAGKWRSGLTIALPGNASAFAGASLSELACASAGNCSAIGTYNAAGAGVEAIVANEVHGAWARASELTLPTNSASNPQVFLFGFNGMACASTGNCSTGGQYIDKTAKYQGFLVNEVSGKWQASSELALPSGSQQASHNGGVVSVSCSSTTTCSAGAAYLDSTGKYQALVVNEVNHVWQPATKISLPANGSSVGVGGGLYAIVCQHSGVCEAIGSYLSGSANYVGFTVNAQ